VTREATPATRRVEEPETSRSRRRRTRHRWSKEAGKRASATGRRDASATGRICDRELHCGGALKEAMAGVETPAEPVEPQPEPARRRAPTTGGQAR